MNNPQPPRILTIAGSDSSGGAGIEADLKTFTALSAYGMAAITAITAQNTNEISAIFDLPPNLVAQQINMAAKDIGVDAAKTGMLSNNTTIEAVAEAITQNAIKKLVVDPVMRSKSGAPLLRDSAQQALKKHILPLAFITTPNIPEAQILAGIKITSPAAIQEAAKRIAELGPKHILIKGGHLEGPRANDYWYDSHTLRQLSAPRINTQNTHGTGCTYSAAITAYLGRGLDTAQAIKNAKEYIQGAIQNSLPFGQGQGPLNHAWRTATKPDNTKNGQ